jgi:TolA-binding protein
MELLGLVLVEKEQAISRLRKEIDEFRIKYNQVQIDIREVIEKKNKELQSVKAN